MDAPFRDLWILGLWGEIPVCVTHIDCPSTPRNVPAGELQRKVMAAAGPMLWRHVLDGTLEPVELPMPPISVIVCTRDRTKSLERTLTSLSNLDYPAFEVIVVDNCPSGNETSGLVANTGFRYALERRPGLDWARNRGVAEAKHDVVAFIDDDAIAARFWLKGIARGFSDERIMAVTGLVLPAELETQAQSDFERYSGMGKGFRRRTFDPARLLRPEQRLQAQRYGVGTNMAFRKQVFRRIGGFDVALDVGTAVGGGGDLEFFHRLIEAGMTLRYEPAALVRHFHRREQADLEKQIRANGRSYSAYLLTAARRNPDMRGAVFVFATKVWIWRWFVRRTFKAILRRDRWSLRVIRLELMGLASGPMAYRRSRRKALALLRQSLSNSDSQRDCLNPELLNPRRIDCSP